MIRNATEKDISLIAEIENKYFSMPRMLEQIHLSDNERYILLCEDECKGYISITTVLDEGYIDYIAVDEQFRKCGIADNLLQAAFNECRKRNLAFLTLEVRQSNLPAINLYTKNGFIEEGRLKNHYVKPSEDAIIMTVRSFK